MSGCHLITTETLPETPDQQDTVSCLLSPVSPVITSAPLSLPATQLNISVNLFVIFLTKTGNFNCPSGPQNLASVAGQFRETLQSVVYKYNSDSCRELFLILILNILTFTNLTLLSFSDCPVSIITIFSLS